MKLLIAFITALSLFFAMSLVANAETTVTTVTTTAQSAAAYKTQSHKKHYKAHKCCKCPHYKAKKHYKVIPATVTYFYTPGYCVADSCACGGEVCYPGRYYQCRTDYYYSSGRNSARVEVCD